MEAVWKKLRSDFPGHALAARASLELAQAAFKKGQFKDTAALARAAAESEEPLVTILTQPGLTMEERNGKLATWSAPWKTLFEKVMRLHSERVHRCLMSLGALPGR